MYFSMDCSISKLDINLRATNPDNVFDIRGIIDLFNITYGSTFPNHEVYLEDFWKERIGNRFISIVAERNSKIIGGIILIVIGIKILLEYILGW